MPDLQPPDLSPPPGTVRPRPLPGLRPDPAEALEANAQAMLGSARRVSLCEDDAQDAVQAAAERYLKHHARVEPETLTGWLVTVARNEALRVRERRVRTGAIDDDDRRLVHTGDGPEDVASREEELALAREALGRLKPQERLALWMQAEGRSYDEIAQELSWTRTKVNRSITEGRASLRRTLAGIATGESCAAAAPRIGRLASGDASSDDLRELRPHLRRCASCRGRLRRARGARWGVLPPLVLAWTPWAGRGGGAPHVPVRTRVTEVVAERLAVVLPATSGVVTEAGLALTTGLAVAALGVGVATGGGAAEDRAPRESERRAVAAGVARPVAATPAPTAPSATASPVAAARTTLVSSGRTLAAQGAAVVAAEEARVEARRAAQARRRAEARARERARARRVAARRRAAAREAAARAAAAAVVAPQPAAPTASTGSGTAGAVGGGTASGGAATGGSGSTAPSAGTAGSGSGSTSGAGGGGSAQDEFGFE